MVERLHTDSLPSVTEDEALELMTHHLQMAAIYFQNTVSDWEPEHYDEVQRIVTRDVPSYTDNPTWLASKAFIEASVAKYELMKKDD